MSVYASSYVVDSAQTTVETLRRRPTLSIRQGHLLICRAENINAGSSISFYNIIENLALRSEPFQMPGHDAPISSVRFDVWRANCQSSVRHVSSGCPSEPDNGQRRRHAIVDKYMSSSSATFDISGALNGVDRRHQSHCRLSMTRRRRARRSQSQPRLSLL